MKLLQWSCTKLKLHTGLAAQAAYLKPRPWHPASVKSYLAWDRSVINVWSIRLSLTPLWQSGRAEAAPYCGATRSGSCEDGFSQDPNRTQHCRRVCVSDQIPMPLCFQNNLPPCWQTVWSPISVWKEGESNVVELRAKYLISSSQMQK